MPAQVPISQQIFEPPASDEFAGQLTIGSKGADSDNIKKLVETFQDPAVQQFLATDPSVKNILLPLQ
jgi:ABC-type metal ion transport system substrate-binding protein